MSVREVWNKGRVLVSEGAELNGLLWYNDHTGVLTFKNDLETRVFQAKSVTGFQFFDEQTQKQRVYYSLEYEDNDTRGRPRTYFFELLREFKAFAVLSKSSSVEVEMKRISTSASPGVSASITYSEASQSETLYFLNTTGEIEPYIRVIKKGLADEYFSGSSYSEKNKMVNEDLLAKFVTDIVYSNLQAYAKLNNLKFKNKEDFLKILDYYALNWANKK
jgi:hypothetical protein